MNRIDRVKSQYPDLNPEEIFSLDPSYNKKFSFWIAEQLSKGHLKEDIRPTIELFIHNKSRLKTEHRDIYKFKDLKDLENLLKDIGTSKRKSKIKVKDSKAVNLGVHDEWEILRIEDKSAAALYGKGTRWCITQIEANYFENYQSENNLFYFLIKGTEKFCAVINKTKNNLTIYNAADEVVKAEESMKKALEVCNKDAEKIPYTFYYGLKEGLLPDEVFLAWWAENKQQFMK